MSGPFSHATLEGLTAPPFARIAFVPLMTRFTPSRSYLVLGLAAAAAAVASVWFALQWAPSWIAVGLFAFTSAALLLLASRPAIRITDGALRLGHEDIPWAAIRRIEHRGWLTPLIVRLTLADHTHAWVVYPGDPDSSTTLLEYIFRFSEHAHGLDENPASALNSSPAPHTPLLRPEDEEEVERLFHRLRSVGHLDPKSDDEK